MEKEFLGDYRIVRKVGEGGMAEVYLAHHKDVPDHKVILKELKDSRLGERFKKEANNLARLNEHANICHIYHFFNEGDHTVIVMEYIEGATLKEVIETEKCLPLNLFLKLAVDLLRILTYAHDRKIYHRDIKPGNIMVDKQGDLKVIDFGIAKDATDPEQTAAGIFTGTPMFAPLEQFNPHAQIDWARADIYAIGTTLYLMITGKMPFEGKTWEEIAEKKRLADPPPPSSITPDIPEAVDRIILKAVSRLPEDRYSSAGEMLKEIEALRTKEIVAPDKLDETIDVTQYSTAAGPSAPTPSPPRRANLKILVPGLSVLVIALGLYLHFGLNLFTSEKQQSALKQTIDTNKLDKTGAIPLPRGTLEVSAGPEADLYVDDSLLAAGISSYAVELDEGEHIVRLANTLSEEKQYVDTVNIKSGQSATIRREFSFKQAIPMGKVSISIDPPGDVYLDGRKVGSSESSLLLTAAIGSHILSVVNSSESVDSTIVDTISMSSDAVLSRSYRFIEKALKGKLLVGTRHTGASIYINGQLQPEKTPFTFNLEPGRYSVRVFMEQPPIDRESTLVITAGDTLRFIVR